MAMDDPWGSSPWADEVQLPTPTKAKDDAPRLLTTIRAPNLGVEEKITSPWGDGEADGFGDWAALPGDQEQTLGLDGAADDWGKHPEDTSDLATGHSSALSLGWNTDHAINIEEPSKLPASPFPGPAPMRQPSPDPWALDIVQEKEYKSEHTQVQDHQEETCDSLAVLENKRLPNPMPETLQSSIETLVPGTEFEDVETATIGDDRLGGTSTYGLDTKENLQKSIDAEPISESQQSDPVSRPSSSRSERSHRDGLLQESPRTSFDEDPKLNRPQAPGKVSTKVQELVHHFDTLVENEDFEPVISRTSSTNPPDEKGEEDEFGDFEEGQSDDEASELEDSRPKVVGQSSITAMRQRQRAPCLENAFTKVFGVVKYEFDPSKLETIFPNNIPDPTSETIFIPDSVPFDSFSSTEQRRTWYRISRYGTMRKHDSGNDENYVRVRWKPSTIRDDTLKIVSRWIEEDRISGRVVLGGGSRGSTVFGWNDLKAPAVPLSDLFIKHGKKRSNVSHAVEVASEAPREWPEGSHSPSKTWFPSSKPRKKSLVKSAFIPVPAEVCISPVVPVANFGWNSGSGATKANDALPTGTRSSGTVLDSIPLSSQKFPPQNSGSSHKSILSAPLPADDVHSHKVTLPTMADNQAAIAPAQRGIPFPIVSTTTPLNDDDAWGEMVSTPATPTAPVIPPTKGLRHKRSQSFGGTVTSFPPGVSKEWMDGQPETSRHSTSDFDEILTPQTLVPTSSSPRSSSSIASLTAPADTFQSPTPSRPQSMLATSDPWASADFSFFETTPVPAPALAPKPVPLSIPLRASNATVPKTLKHKLHKTPPAAFPQSNQKSREELEQDLLVQSVVKGLPDLSYMLRR